MAAYREQDTLLSVYHMAAYSEKDTLLSVYHIPVYSAEDSGSPAVTKYPGKERKAEKIHLWALD